jgi:hypothetical protein
MSPLGDLNHELIAEIRAGRTVSSFSGATATVEVKSAGLTSVRISRRLCLSARIPAPVDLPRNITLSQMAVNCISVPRIVPTNVSRGRPLEFPDGVVCVQGLLPMNVNEKRSPAILPSRTGPSPGQLPIFAVPVSLAPSDFRSKTISETVFGCSMIGTVNTAFHVPVRSAAKD